MKNVISVLSLLLVLVAIESQGNPKPQSYAASAQNKFATRMPESSDTPGVLGLQETPGLQNTRRKEPTGTPSPADNQTPGWPAWRTPGGNETFMKPPREESITTPAWPTRQPQHATTSWPESPSTRKHQRTTTLPQRKPASQFEGHRQQDPQLEDVNRQQAPHFDVNKPVDHCDSTHLNYPHPGAKYPGTDHKLTFCCSSNMDQSATNTADEVADNSRSVNNDLRQFALDLLIKLVNEEPGKNLVFSPFSVWNVLLMTLEGAAENSITSQQIRETLYLHNITTAKIQSNFQELECSLRAASKFSEYIGANALFRDQNKPLEPAYENIVLQKYQSDLFSLNLSKKTAAANEVNSWVRNKTHDRIKTLVEPRDLNDFNLILANAIFFKGNWDNPFNATATAKKNFFDEHRRVVSSVDMMYQRGSYLYSFIQEINAHVLDIPYEGKHFRMLIVLPKFNDTLVKVLTAMKKFPVNLCYERLVLEQEMYSDEEVHVYVPRFKVKSDLQLKSTLQNMGITNVFAPNAQLSKMSTSNQLYLAKIVHAAEIEVNEEGTVASAITGGMFGNKSKPPNFVANRPFAYFIVENTRKTVIFAGKVVDPVQRSQT